ncbi:Ref family recombination enhancement nuclease [Klebsiella pneumoniae]|uniref:Ref family recombination enhancement nuclease n=1 Tax=Klebsiella pneumoniae TaxID=573 RepID=UPI0025A22610|nr:Ref family recombination enhancement nuclease [Klebsiella pneumoniae]MDM7308515.1 Ref family recombination enhancement nuclease [Klebsiella pneumoniae]
MELTEQQIARRRQRASEARQRAIAKQRAKLSDPAWREEQYRKRRESEAKRRARKLASPTPPPAKLRKPIKSRGLKGRTPTAEERRVADALGALPSIACYMHGVINTEISLHHIEGRTAPDCHKKQLPLCKWHHQCAAPPEIRKIHPWLVPVHADGAVGGKAAFSALNKPEAALLVDAYTMADILF